MRIVFAIGPRRSGAAEAIGVADAPATLSENVGKLIGMFSMHYLVGISFRGQYRSQPLHSQDL